MLDWLLRSIGVGEDVMSHLDKAEFAFQRPALFWIGVLLLLPIGWFIYRRQQRNLPTVPRRLRAALSGTRIAILTLLVFVLAGPQLRIDYREQSRPVLAILLDRSESMELPAAPFASSEDLASLAGAAGYEVREKDVPSAARQALEAMSREQLAAAVLTKAHERVLKPLEERFELRYYTVAERCAPWAFDPQKSPADLETLEGRGGSHLGEALAQVMEDTAGRTLSGIVLVSDGMNTGGRSPAEAARAASQRGVPLYTVPVGPAQRMRDVAIVDVHTSGVVSKGDTARIAVTLQSQGFDDRSVPIELRNGDTLLDSKEIVLNGNEPQQVELTFEAEEPGSYYLTVAVPAQAEEDERLKVNNSDLAYLRVSDEKLRILYIEGVPRWDFRFLKNALRRDHGITGRAEEGPDIVLETEWRREPSGERASALPASVDEFAEYHLVLLGDVSPELLRPDVQQRMAEAVRTKGLGVIVAAGPLKMPHAYSAEFQELLPVQLQPGANGVLAPAYKPFQVEVSPEGLLHEAMRLYDDPARSENSWAEMPAFHWAAAAIRPSAAATVLAWNSQVENRFGKMPLIAWQYAGRGKVVFIGTDSTWHWRQNVGDRYFYRFWGQMIRFAARTEEDAARRSRIAVRPVRARVGEQVEVELFALAQEATPRREEQLAITVVTPEASAPLTLVADRDVPGRYTGQFLMRQPGEYAFRYEAPQSDQSCEALVRVLPNTEELRDPNLNRPLLELMASSTGGQTLALHELDAIPPKLKGEPTLRELHREASVWDNWLVLVLLSCIYAADVGIRRLTGLS